MKVTLKGVRGSIPTTGAETSFYGGNTSCTVVTEDNWILVLDGGSGMQKVTVPDTSIKRVDILLTHLHLDHIQGLGYFGPLFDPTMEVHIWAPSSATQSLHSRLSRYLSPPLFPVLIRDLPAKLTLHDIENSHFEIGPFTVDSRYVIHPGPTVGFRIQGRHSVFAYIPDHEPALGVKELTSDKKWISGYDIIADADLLLHDAQYTREEYPTKIGWGHSCIDDTLRLASIAGVKHLLLAHHDPSHTDEKLVDIFTDIVRRTNYGFKYELAREGMEIDLD
jgi:phosphoribosyl 1,2-cyclic phosphodiesterase